MNPNSKALIRGIVSTKKNIHRGGNFTEYLRVEGIYEEVEAAAIKKVIAAALR